MKRDLFNTIPALNLVSLRDSPCNSYKRQVSQILLSPQVYLIPPPPSSLDPPFSSAAMVPPAVQISHSLNLLESRRSECVGT